MALILVRYGEIALKGQNRAIFVRQLRRNMRRALRAGGVEGTVYEEDRRLFVATPAPAAAMPYLRRVFGIVSLSEVVKVESDIAEMRVEALRMAAAFGLSAAHTFATESRRADKTFPHISPEINRLVGGVVQEATGARVDLSGGADFSIGIEVRRDGTYMYGETTPAFGGLPLPLSGRAVVLLSGGIDSPVAAWMLMKRGCGVIPLHFSHDAEETQKVLDNVEVLRQYSYGWGLDPVIIPHDQVMVPAIEALARAGAGRWACVFCKRLMLQKAAELADERGAQAIVLGDSLGQVASQTLENIEVISHGISKPILRPLIGMDKVEITALARKIGSFDISTRTSSPCAYLPDNPLTKGSVAHLKEILEKLEHV